MTQAAFSGPIISFGAENPGPDNNGSRGPSVFDQAWMLMDPQAPYAYAGGNSWRGWMSAGEFTTIDYIPGTSGAGLIAAAQTGSSPLTLATASAGSINIGASVVNLNTGVTVTGLLAIDSIAGRALFYGSDQYGSAWNPGVGGGRNVTITPGATESAGTIYTVSGYDYRGAPMTEAITASGSSNLTTGAKAFKFISTVTTSTSVAGAQVGVGTICGLPIRADSFAYISVSWASTAGTSTRFTAAVTSAANSTSGDVRGTYNLNSAIDATTRLVLFQRISAANISTQSGIVGVTQA